MYETLKTILVDDLQLMEADIRPDARHEEVGLDSLAFVELSLALSKRLDLEISDDELLDTATVADIADLISRRTSARLAQATG